MISAYFKHAGLGRNTLAVANGRTAQKNFIDIQISSQKMNNTIIFILLFIVVHPQ